MSNPKRTGTVAARRNIPPQSKPLFPFVRIALIRGRMQLGSYKGILSHFSYLSIPSISELV